MEMLCRYFLVFLVGNNQVTSPPAHSVQHTLGILPTRTGHYRLIFFWDYFSGLREMTDWCSTLVTGGKAGRRAEFKFKFRLNLNILKGDSRERVRTFLSSASKHCNIILKRRAGRGVNMTSWNIGKVLFIKIYFVLYYTLKALTE